MIAVMTDREWVAMPRPGVGGLLFGGSRHARIVAVVDPQPFHTLTGFARVVEILPTVEDIESLPGAPALVQLTAGSARHWPGGSVHEKESELIDLPYAEPGGLALRLKPMRFCLWCNGAEPPCLCVELGQPTTITNLYGEIGRWER